MSEVVRYQGGPGHVSVTLPGSRGGLDVGQFCLTQYGVLRSSRGRLTPHSLNSFRFGRRIRPVNGRSEGLRQWFIDTSDEDYKNGFVLL